MNGDPATDPIHNWGQGIVKLASFSKVYMKISGGFSEMDALPSGARQGAWDSLARQQLFQETRMWVERWLQEVLTAFGPKRIMFASDWPICNVGGGGNQVSWINWWSIVDGFIKDSMSEESQLDFWSSNAGRTYGLDIQVNTIQA